MLYLKKHNLWAKLVALLLVFVLVFNDLSWAYAQIAVASKTALQTSTSLNSNNFKAKFFLKAFLLKHKDTIQLYGSTIVITALLFKLIHSYFPEKALSEFFGFKNMPYYFTAFSYTNSKIIVSYNVFLSCSEIFAQLIDYTNNKKTQPDLSFKIDWQKIKAVILLTTLLYCWFWPFTYKIWLKPDISGKVIPLWLIGFADQPFTGLISIIAAFLTHSYIEKSRNNNQTLWQTFRGKSRELVQTLRKAFPYWVIVLGIIFGLPAIGISIDFSTQNMWVSISEILFAIYMFYLAGKQSTTTQKLEIKPWAKYAIWLTFTCSITFFVFKWYPIISTCAAIWFMLLNSILYSLVIYFGFKNKKTNTTNISNTVEPITLPGLKPLPINSLSKFHRLATRPLYQSP